MKNLNIIRKFERFNFHGVPESPEPSYERNHNAQYTERQTGKPITSNGVNHELAQFPIIGYIVDDHNAHEEKFFLEIKDTD